MRSQPFWACGYRLQLWLHQKLSSNDSFLFAVTLNVLNLKEDRFTSLSWGLKYDGKTIFSQMSISLNLYFMLMKQEKGECVRSSGLIKKIVSLRWSFLLHIQ